jgi:hypothetical protein
VTHRKTRTRRPATTGREVPSEYLNFNTTQLEEIRARTFARARKWGLSRREASQLAQITVTACAA